MTTWTRETQCCLRACLLVFPTVAAACASCSSKIIRQAVGVEVEPRKSSLSRLMLDGSNQYIACPLSPMLGDNKQVCKPWRYVMVGLNLRLGQKTRSDWLAIVDRKRRRSAKIPFQTRIGQTDRESARSEPDLRQERASRSCGHLSRAVVSDFRSLRGDIVFRLPFGAQVSGDRNPVPNSKSQAAGPSGIPSFGGGEQRRVALARALE